MCEPVVQFLLKNHVLGGVVAQVHVGCGNAQRLLAILGKDHGIVLGERHIRDEPVMLISNNQRIGVVAHDFGFGNIGINFGDPAALLKR